MFSLIKKILKFCMIFIGYSLIVLFLLSILLLILFAACGYRYNFKAKKIQKTGILDLSFYPSDAEILIEGKKIYKKERPWPLTLFYPDKIVLFPGNYEIEIKKEGFYSWKKEIKIQEELVTRISNIILFPKNLSPTLVLKEINTFKISPDFKKLAFIPKSKDLEGIWLFYLRDGSQSKIFPVTKTQSIYWEKLKLNSFEKIFWENSRYLILNYQTFSVKIDTFWPQNSIFLKEKILPPIDFSQAPLYWNKENELWIINPQTKEKKLVSRFSYPIQQALFYDKNHIIYANKKEIKVIEIDGENEMVLTQHPFSNLELFSFDKETKKLIYGNKENIFLLDLNY